MLAHLIASQQGRHTDTRRRGLGLRPLPRYLRNIAGPRLLPVGEPFLVCILPAALTSDSYPNPSREKSCSIEKVVYDRQGLCPACVCVVSSEEDEPLALLQQPLGLLGQHHRLGLIGVDKRRREGWRRRDEGRGRRPGFISFDENVFDDMGFGKARTRRERKRCDDRRLITSLKRTGKRR